MQRLGFLVEGLGVRLHARSAQPARAALLESTSFQSQAPLHLRSDHLTSASALPGLRDFSSQNAASPEPAATTEQTSTQPLARIKPKDMVAIFTCNKCNTRSAKMFSKQTYETGVVIVRCPGCNGNHLIADRLGWFGEPGSVENYLQEQGQEVLKRTMDGTTQLTAEDLMGWSQSKPGTQAQ